MIKVIIERRLRKGEDISPLLRELRVTAMHQSGYVTGEALVGTEDRANIVAVSTWQSLEHWKAWETSRTRAQLYKRIRPLLLEEPKIKVYETVAPGK